MVLGDSWCSMVPRCLLSPLGSLLLFGVLASVELLAYSAVFLVNSVDCAYVDICVG